ncbi:MAG: thioredoxin-dependent thiol peroxidase [Bacteroidetes bacterium MED-G17]|jgi:peroxiredoxin Q/BCP|nr:MAG: thioredoxin-dependent thiol peroxidase [Bacteroidetes bacterium TMED39]PDH52491.1 MAG: thioredoxin-dependent thiol peroxidase [Bacteroidetes bacterium MED-G17]|tara:strand:+ start:8259 stop:8711 length:453 start_codon:yes stop_codon:yes gene_type:complete
MATVELNQKAPDFEAKNQQGEIVNLAQYKGKKLVLYFYPKDDTPGCTKEACNLRDNYTDLKKQGYEVLGVSPDNEAKHQKFIGKYDLPFDLLADPEHTVSEAYGVWVEKNMYGRTYMGIKRTTFIINEEGIVEEIIKKVKTDDHTKQILK